RNTAATIAPIASGILDRRDQPQPPAAVRARPRVDVERAPLQGSPHLPQRIRRPCSWSSNKVERTGLGLTRCRRFVELHGREIWVKGQVGVGPTFTFTPPVRRDE